MILITNKIVHTSILMHVCAYIVCVCLCAQAYVRVVCVYFFTGALLLFDGINTRL